MRYNKVKLLAVLLGLSLCLGGLTACTATETGSQTTSQTKVKESEIDLSSYSGEIVITKGGSYTLSGTLENGQVVVDAEGDIVELVLSDATITSEAGVAIYVENAESVTITLADGTTNTITTSGTYSDEKIDAAIFAKCDLTMDGTGSLSIVAANSDAVYSKGELYVNDGNYTIQTADGAVEVKSGSDNFGGGNFGGFGGGGNRGNRPGSASSGETTDGQTTDGQSSDAAGQQPTMPDGSSFDPSQMQQMTPPDNSDFDPSQMQGMTPPDNSDFDPSQMQGMTPPDNSSFDPSQMQGMTPPDNSNFDPSQMQQPADASTGDTTTEGTTSATTTGSTDSEDDTSLKGLKAKKGITIAGGTFTFDTADDSIHSNGYLTITGGTFTIASGDDGLHAEEALVIDNGTINITKCYEGIEGLTITINGGDISVISNDDGMNAANPDGTNMIGTDDSCVITINGGDIYVEASGDGLDSNGNMNINGGTIIVKGSTNGADSAIDYGDGGILTITGGTLLAMGNSSMAENASESSTQAVFLATLSSYASGTITITDADGNVLITYENDRQYNSVLYTSDQLMVGDTYTITTDAGSTEVTMDSIVTGESSGGFGGFMHK